MAKRKKTVEVVKAASAYGVKFRGAAMSFAWPVKAMSDQFLEKFVGTSCRVVVLLESDWRKIQKQLKEPPHAQ